VSVKKREGTALMNAAISKGESQGNACGEQGHGDGGSNLPQSKCGDQKKKKTGRGRMDKERKCWRHRAGPRSGGRSSGLNSL